MPCDRYTSNAFSFARVLCFVRSHLMRNVFCRLVVVAAREGCASMKKATLRCNPVNHKVNGLSDVLLG